jgi:hypothetical protein
MARVLPLLTVVAAVAFSGVVQGVWTNRWGQARAVEAAAKLEGVPMTLGDWDGQRRELSAREVAVAEINGYLLRRYVNRRTGDVVSLLIVCGPPGPVSVHTPEVCYRGAGYAQVGAAFRYSTRPEGSAEFLVRQFQKENAAVPTHLRILYGWGAAGAWTAPDNPRVAFARSPALYKIYVSRELVKEDEVLEGDPATDFVKVLMPELQRALFPDS